MDGSLVSGPDGDIFVDVDTSAFGFTSTPHYVASFYGSASHHMTTGGSSIYMASPMGFRVWIKNQYKNGQVDPMTGQPTTTLTKELANQRSYRIGWVAEHQSNCLGAGNSDYHPPGSGDQKTVWNQYCVTAADGSQKCTGVYTDIHFKPGFVNAPIVVSALHGESHHSDARGANEVYQVTNTGFRVYIHSTALCAPCDATTNTCPPCQPTISTSDALVWKWKINYLATEDFSRAGYGSSTWTDTGAGTVENDVNTVGIFQSGANFVTSL